MNEALLNAAIPAFASILICLGFSAFFSSAETAITSLPPLKVKHLIEQKGKLAASLNLWLDFPSRVLMTILIFNNIVNILASAIATAFATQFFQDRAIGISTGLITILVILFGEILPKTFAKSHAEFFALYAMRGVSLFYYMAFPVLVGLEKLTAIMFKITSQNSKHAPAITEEELEFLVSESKKAGVIEDLKNEIIEGAFEFDETRVREIMTPRTDIYSIDVTGSLFEAIVLTTETGHSRIPVYKGTIDRVVGVLFAKDLLLHTQKSEEEKKSLTVASIMRDAFFEPESKTIMEVFKDLKRTKNHLAIIIDEYGGTAGIITMEDILEEIVGDIQDEFDTEEAEIKEIEPGVFEVAGSIHVEVFRDFFGISEADLTDEERELDADTLAGWITQVTAQMPRVGQKIKVSRLELEVVGVKHRRIERIVVRRPPFTPSPSQN